MGPVLGILKAFLNRSLLKDGVWKMSVLCYLFLELWHSNSLVIRQLPSSSDPATDPFLGVLHPLFCFSLLIWTLAVPVQPCGLEDFWGRINETPVCESFECAEMKCAVDTCSVRSPGSMVGCSVMMFLHYFTCSWPLKRQFHLLHPGKNSPFSCHPVIIRPYL